jgi:hypothetical protein
VQVFDEKDIALTREVERSLRDLTFSAAEDVEEEDFLPRLRSSRKK